MGIALTITFCVITYKTLFLDSSLLKGGEVFIIVNFAEIWYSVSVAKYLNFYKRDL